jgi:hypothetical protein
VFINDWWSMKALLLSLCTKGNAVHRANLARLKLYYVFWHRAKTDNLDVSFSLLWL